MRIHKHLFFLIFYQPASGLHPVLGLPCEHDYIIMKVILNMWMPLGLEDHEITSLHILLHNSVHIRWYCA